MRIKGERARVALRDIVDQLHDHLPAALTVTVGGEGKVTILSVVPDVPTRDSNGDIGSPVSIARRIGFGSAIPFLPSNVARRAIAIDLMTEVADGITTASLRAWPGAEFKAKAAVDGQAVRAWYEGPAKKTAFPVAIHL